MKATHWAIRSRALLPAVLCVPLLSACWNGRILFFFEQPFWSSIAGESRLRTTLVVSAAAHGYFPRIEVQPEGTDPSVSPAGKLDPQGYAAVIVGPLLSFEWEGFVAKYPQTRFVLIGAPVPPQAAPPNAVFLTFDRTEAFLEAGRTAGKEVRARFGAVDPARLGSRIAVVTSVDSDVSAAEVDAFARGVAESLDGGRPESRFLAAPVDAGAVTAAVSQMRRAGAEIFLLGLGEHDPAGLQALHDVGGSAVLGDWQVSGAFPSQVLLSVEEDVPGGIALALDGLRSGVTRVQGPVRLVSGKKI